MTQVFLALEKDTEKFHETTEFSKKHMKDIHVEWRMISPSPPYR